MSFGARLCWRIGLSACAIAAKESFPMKFSRVAFLAALLPALGCCAQMQPPITVSMRQPLTTSQNYFVNGDSVHSAPCGPTGTSICAAGNDSNTGLSSSSPWLTLQHALNFILSNVDVAGHGVAINLAHVSSANYAAECAQGPFIGTSVISIQGDSTAPTAVTIIDPAGGAGLEIKDGCTLDLNNVAFADAPTHNASHHIIVGATGNAGHLDYSGLTLGALPAGSQISVGALGQITALGSLTYTGGAIAGLSVSGSGQMAFNSQTVTMSGTPAYSTAFLVETDGGDIEGVSPSTFSGSATGPRCLILGPVNIANGANPNSVFPGSANCVPNTFVGTIAVPTGSSYGYGAAGQPLVAGGGSGSPNTYATAAQMRTFTEQGLTLLNVLIASNSPTLSDTNSFTSTYDDYEIVFDNIVPTLNKVGLVCQVHSGGAFQSTGYLNIAGGTTTGIDLTSGAATIFNGAGTGLSGDARLHNANSTSVNKWWNFDGVDWYLTASRVRSAVPGGVWNGGQGAIDGFQCEATRGSISSGVIKIYGRRNAP